jgi:hypothetical protein
MPRDFTGKSIWEEMEEAQTIRSSNVPATGKFGIALVLLLSAGQVLLQVTHTSILLHKL